MTKWTMWVLWVLRFGVGQAEMWDHGCVEATDAGLKSVV